MAEYHYIYTYAGDKANARAASGYIKNRLKEKGCDNLRGVTLRPASQRVLRRVINGHDPLDKYHNWLEHFDTETLRDFDPEEMVCCKLRVTERYDIDILDIVQCAMEQHDAKVMIRMRHAEHSNQGPPFSYDYQNDYKTEPSFNV